MTVIATGVSEARSHSAPWEENAHAHDSHGREARNMRSVLNADPPKRSSGVVKRPVPWSCRTEP